MEHATLGSENGKYSENAKFGYSVMFIIAIIVFCICLATGKVYLIIAGLLFSTVIIIGCFGAVKSDRWDD